MKTVIKKNNVINCLFIRDFVLFFLFGGFLVFSACAHSYSVVKFESPNNMTLVLKNPGGDVYKISGGEKRHIPDIKYKEVYVIRNDREIDSEKYSLSLFDIERNESKANGTLEQGTRLPPVCKVVFNADNRDPLTDNPSNTSSSSEVDELKNTVWWDDKKSHDDQIILSKKINWSDFAKRVNLTNKILKIGAFLHYGHPYSFRQKNWAKITGVGKSQSVYSHIFSSVVPYIWVEGKQYIMVPDSVKVKDFSPNFKGFAINSFDDEQYDMRCESYPHYYPTLTIIPQKDADKISKKIIRHLDEKKPGELFLIEPVAINSGRLRNIRTVRQFLNAIWRKKSDFPFLTDLNDAFKKVRKLKIALPGYESFLYTIRPFRRLEIPSEFVKTLKNNNIPLPGNIAVEDCVFVDQGWKEKIKINCGQTDIFKTKIIGFKPFEKKDTISMDIIRVSIYDLEADATLRIKDGSWWFDNKEVNTQNNKITLKYREIGKELRLNKKKGEKSLSDLLFTVSWNDVFEGKTVVPKRQIVEIKANWSVKWGKPINIENVLNAKYDEKENAYHLTCNVKVGMEMIMFWGHGWDAVRIMGDDNKSVELNSELRPRWLFSDQDNWWKDENQDNLEINCDPCENEPKYILSSVKYAGEDEKGKFLSKSLDVNYRDRFPSLKDIRWEKDWPMPSRIILELRQSPLNAHLYRSEAEIGWQLSSVEKNHNYVLEKDFKINLLSEPLPIKQLARPLVNYSDNIALSLFYDSESCKKGTKRYHSEMYIPETLESLNIKPCNYAKLYENGKPLTDCVRSHMDENGQRVMFDFFPIRCPEKRKLIVLSMSKGLAKIKAQKIGEHLKNFFFQMKDENLRIPVVLLYIDTGRVLKSVINCEKIHSIAKYGADDSIAKRLTFMNFNAMGLEALDDLKLVDRMFSVYDLDEVLYVTDNAGMHFDENEKGKLILPGDKLGVPLNWAKNKIKLTVLTTGACDVWERYTSSECHICYNVNQIVEKIEDFLIYDR